MIVTVLFRSWYSKNSRLIYGTIIFVACESYDQHCGKEVFGILVDSHHKDIKFERFSVRVKVLSTFRLQTSIGLKFPF